MTKHVAVENYIKSASNPSRAAWKVINSDTSPSHTSEFTLDPYVKPLLPNSVSQLQDINPSVHSTPREF